MTQFEFVRGSIQGPGELFGEFEVRILIKRHKTCTNVMKLYRVLTKVAGDLQLFTKKNFCAKKAPAAFSGKVQP